MDKTEIEVLQAGKEYNLNNSVGTKGIILEIQKDIALIKTHEYIVVTGIKQLNDGTIEWDYGKYFDNLVQASFLYESKIFNQKQQIENLKEILKEINDFVRFGAIVELETNYDNDAISEGDLKKLEIIYDEYTSNDEFHLLSEEIDNLEESYNINSIRDMIQEYLYDNDIDSNLIPIEESMLPAFAICRCKITILFAHTQLFLQLFCNYIQFH